MQLTFVLALASMGAQAALASSALLGADHKVSMRGRGGSGGATAAAQARQQALQQELADAMGEALGCGGHVDAAKLKDIEGGLLPMWRTLPKNAVDNVDRRSLRYLVHRHFNRKSALHIRGFEPSRPLNASGWGDADIISQRVPAFVESVLESRHRAESGFSLADAAHVVAVLEQLIYDSEGQLLQRAYRRASKTTSQALEAEGIRKLLEAYMVHWMLGDDQESAEYLLRNRTLLETALPHWDQLVHFAHGHASALEYQRQTSPLAAQASGKSRPGFNALSSRYSFEDAHGMAGEITRSFASYWEAQCDSMKMQLVEMDTHHTGRVPLSKFYGTGLDADWRFGESEEYLRELGALDETSWRGKQVIIPNYIQAASNCIVAGNHYRVCCVNDCEVLLDDIERKIAAPTASPEAILAVVGNLSRHISIEDDEPPAVDASLRAQLSQISEAHSGEVPIHGRLFAQWLHYVFPRECPFPHKSGAANITSPLEYGAGHIANREEMRRYASEANTSDLPATVGKEELEWMSQWSPEEELITDIGLRRPWQRSTGVVAGAALCIVMLLGVLGMGGAKKSFGKGGGLLPSYQSPGQKAHFV